MTKSSTHGRSPWGPSGRTATSGRPTARWWSSWAEAPGRCSSSWTPRRQRRFRPSPPGEGACSLGASEPETTSNRPRAWPGRRRLGGTAGGPLYRGQGSPAALPCRRRRAGHGPPGGPAGPRAGTTGTRRRSRSATKRARPRTAREVLQWRFRGPTSEREPVAPSDRPIPRPMGA